MTLRLAAAALAAVVVLGACGQPDRSAEATPADKIEELDPTFVPDEMNDLVVRAENQSELLKQARLSYIDGIGLLSLRDREELLQATLQVSRFNENARVDDPGFRQQVVAQIGGTRPRATRLGNDTVWLTTGTKQRLAAWFRDRYLFILGVRDEYPQPRTLIRQALEIRP